MLGAEAGAETEAEAWVRSEAEAEVDRDADIQPGTRTTYSAYYGCPWHTFLTQSSSSRITADHTTQTINRHAVS